MWVNASSGLNLVDVVSDVEGWSTIDNEVIDEPLRRLTSIVMFNILLPLSRSIVPKGRDEEDSNSRKE